MSSLLSIIMLKLFTRLGKSLVISSGWTPIWQSTLEVDSLNYVQIDIEKPLITEVMMGKFEQTVSYEGIHELCFSCGRIGHWNESCPYTI